MLGLIRFTELTVRDDVSGGCWTNSAYITSKVKLLLEQNDVAVLEYEPLFLGPVVVNTEISAFGFRDDNGTCAVHAKLQVYSHSYEEFGDISHDESSYVMPRRVSLFSGGALFVNSNKVNEQLSEFIEGQAAEFLSGVLSGRRDSIVQEFFVDFPAWLDKPISSEELNNQDSN